MSARGFPIDAATRGRLRLLRAQLSVRFARLERVLASKAFGADAVSLALRKSKVGRSRAFARLRAALEPTGAVLESARLDGQHAIATWAIVRPRISVAVCTEETDPALAQDCFVIEYIVAGALPTGHALGAGLYSIEIPDHGLGRLLQRCPSADPVSVLLEAHCAVLGLPVKDVIADGHVDPDAVFYVPAGPGVFTCHCSMTPDVSTKEVGLHVRAHTWLHQDQLRDDQVPLADAGAPGERLGDSWLLPAPLRRVVATGHGRFSVEVWKGK